MWQSSKRTFLKPAPVLSASTDDELPSSMREVAAYLQGVADAVQMSQRAGAPVDEPPARRTLPIGAEPCVTHRTLPLLSVPSEHDNDTDVEAWADERQSEVRLRIPKLAPEWYELTGTDEG
jgi:hypothetical protein